MISLADLIEVMKKAALDAVEASKPVAVMYGRVTGVSPLKIRLDQRMELEAGQLVLLRSVGELFAGDSVVLLRQQGGKKFIVIGVTI